MVQEPRAPDTLFFRVFGFLSPPSTHWWSERTQTDRWPGSLEAAAFKEIIILAFYTAKKTAKRPDSLPAIKIVPRAIISQRICMHWQTSAAQGDFVLGLMTLRYQKHWPTITNFCRSCYLQSASSNRKTSRKYLQSLHRHSETSLPVPMFLPGLGFTIRITLDRETKLWTQRKAPESFSLIILKFRGERPLEHLNWRLESHFSVPKTEPFEALPIHFIWQLLTINATSTSETPSCSWQNPWQHHQM